jgi:RNA polymerase sigma-70 factor (ECF subfamily)
VSTVRSDARATLVYMDVDPAPQRSLPLSSGQGVDSPVLDDERELVAAAKTDIEAFSVLYRHYLPRIHAFAWRRTGSVQAAEDICAATFEAALRNIGSFRWREPGIGPWLFRIAANQTVDHHRRESRPGSERGQRAMATMHEPAEANHGPDWIADDHHLVRDAMGRLSPRYQRAISLRYLADLAHDDAARAMQLTKPAFAVVLSRALKALRRELERNGGAGHHDR